MCARGWRWLLGAWLWLAAPGCAANLLPPSADFEVGRAGFHLRADDGEAAALDGLVAAHGDVSVRLRGGHAAAIEWSWVRLQPGADITFSAACRTDSPGLTADVVLSGAGGEAARATLRLSRDWRRYEAPFQVPRESPWLRVAVTAGRGAGTLWLDAARLELGPATPFVPEPALGVQLHGSQRLRQAGDRADFDVSLQAPGGGRFPVRWRLEDGFGRPVRRGTETVSVPAHAAGEARARIARLEPGAWRLVAEADVAGRRLTEDATAVAATFELGDPDRWGGAADAGDDASRAVFDLLRLGLHRLTAARRDGPTATEARLLLAVRRARGAAQAALPPLTDPAELTSLVRRYGGQVSAWELAGAAQAEAVRAADRRAQTYGPVEVVRLGAEPPETAGGVGVAALVARAGGTEHRPVGVLAEGWVAEPWDRSLAASPTGAARRVMPLEQAAYVARAVLLARAAGTAWFAYAGELARDGPQRHSLAEVGLAPDLCAYDGAPLPALAALDQVMDRVRGRSVVEAVALARGVACLRWAGRRPLASLWHWRDPAATAQVLLALAPEQLRAVDLFGRGLPLRAVDGGVAVPVTFAPVYLEPYRLGSEAFAEALRQAVLTGLPTVEAGIVPLADGVGVRLENTGNHLAAGRVRMGGGAEPFAALPPQGTREIRSAGQAPDWGVDAALQVTVESGGESYTATRLVRRMSCPRGEPAAEQPLTRVLAGVAAEPVDLAAHCGAAWDAAGLKLRVDVADERVTDGDAVELALDPSPAGGASALVRQRFAGAALTQTPTGYTVTAAWPWRAPFTTEPWPGLVLGFNVVVRDDDGAGEETVLGWLPQAGAPGWLVLR